MKSTFISNRRKEQGFTQDEMAKKLGINKQTYAKYENRDKFPFDTLAEIGVLLGFTIIFLPKENIIN